MLPSIDSFAGGRGERVLDQVAAFEHRDVGVAAFQDVHAHEVATRGAPLAGAAAAPLEDVVVEVGGGQLAHAEVGTDHVVDRAGTVGGLRAPGCGCRIGGGGPVAGTGAAASPAAPAPATATLLLGLTGGAVRLGRRPICLGRRRGGRGAGVTDAGPGIAGGRRRCRRTAVTDLRRRRRRRESGLLAGDVGDVVGGEAAVGGLVGVVLGDERVGLIGLVGLVGVVGVVGLGQVGVDLDFEVGVVVNVGVVVGGGAVRRGRRGLAPPVAPTA